MTKDELSYVEELESAIDAASVLICKLENEPRDRGDDVLLAGLLSQRSGWQHQLHTLASEPFKGSHMDKEQVYRLIDAEIQFRQTPLADKAHRPPVTIGDYLHQMNFANVRAMQAYQESTNDDPVMEEVRRLAGIAVLAIEAFGAPSPFPSIESFEATLKVESPSEPTDYEKRG